MEPGKAGMLAMTLLLTNSIAAQSQWTVTQQDGIQAAIQAAAPGDVIVLQPQGSIPLGEPDFFGFHLDKGLTIFGNGATVGTKSTPFPIPSSITVTVPPGQMAHFVGIDSLQDGSRVSAPGFPVTVLAGVVRFEDCHLLGRNSPALHVVNADVVVSGGSIASIGYGVFAALHADHATVALRDCDLGGADSSCDQILGCSVAYPAVPAARLVDCVLQAERCILRGGDHGSAFAGSPAPALELVATRTWLRQCTLLGGSGLNTGAPAVSNNGTIPLEQHLVLAVPGTPNAPPTVGPVVTNPGLLGLRRSGPWTRGFTASVSVQGAAYAPFGIWVAPDAWPIELPFLAQPAWLLTGEVVTLGLLDSLGGRSLSVPVPNLPALLGAPVWCQAVSGFDLPLQLSTIAGGAVH